MRTLWKCLLLFHSPRYEGTPNRLVLSLQVRASKGNAILQSQSSTETDVKEETTSPTPAASAEPAVKAEPDTGSSTPSSAGESLHNGHIQQEFLPFIEIIQNWTLIGLLIQEPQWRRSPERSPRWQSRRRRRRRRKRRRRRRRGKL